MNRITKTILSLAALVTFVTGCSEQPDTPPDPDYVPVESVDINPNQLSLKVGETYNLTATVLPEIATTKSLSWVSNNPSKLSVDQNGHIEAISEGEFTVTATSTAHKDISDYCTVTVSDSEIPPVDDDYYASIKDTDTGLTLLNKLKALNKSKRESTVGYDSMGTTPSGMFKYTDYDPATVQYDTNGQPYGTRLISFYSGNSAVSGLNREHVWPKSHGGNLVDKDIHMTRPCLNAENGSRGNSFYVTGMKDGSKGWDPAAEDFGKADYRGDSARIIFYCVLADFSDFPSNYLEEPATVEKASRLTLVDVNSHDSTNSNRDNLMGKLSNLLEWNNTYPVQDREQRRNSGAEYLQGNRNPFIDHPEYACRIWGLYNNNTKTACGLA